MYYIDQILNREFYEKPAEQLAKDLLGKLLVREFKGEIIVGKIVETEAYLPFVDEAAHSYIGKTERNKSTFGPAGHAYVHLIHNHACLDIVGESEGVPGSVLIRALEPVEGIEIMKKNRGVTDLMKLTSGPGKLCQALGISKSDDGLDMTVPENGLFIKSLGDILDNTIIGASPRIGISKARDLPLRFFIKNSPFLSRK